MIKPQSDVFMKPETPASATSFTGIQSHSEGCTRIRNLGFKPSRHIKMYGERFEIVSDPFSEGTGIAVHAISGTDPKIRILRLPITLLLGQADRFLRKEI